MASQPLPDFGYHVIPDGDLWAVEWLDAEMGDRVICRGCKEMDAVAICAAMQKTLEELLAQERMK